MDRHFITLVKQGAEAVASFVPRFECSCVEEERRREPVGARRRRRRRRRNVTVYGYV